VIRGLAALNFPVTPNAKLTPTAASVPSGFCVILAIPRGVCQFPDRFGLVGAGGAGARSRGVTHGQMRSYTSP